MKAVLEHRLRGDPEVPWLASSLSDRYHAHMQAARRGISRQADR
jgi:hypothetical protein